MGIEEKVLVVGAGGIAQRHIRGFLKTGRVVLGIVEPHEGRRDATIQQHGIGQAYARIEDVDLAAWRAAVICAPANFHVPLASACARAGLPFLLEKPLAVTMDGVDALLDTVAVRKLPARVAYVRRASPETIELAARIRAGAIGDVRLAYVNVSQEFPKYRPDFQRTYYAHPEMGGGAILDAASHIIDLVQWIMGEVSEVAAMYDRLALPGVAVEDTCLISLRFRSGAMVQININQFQKPNTGWIEFVGTRGNLAIDGTVLKAGMDDSGTWGVTDYRDGLSPGDYHEARFRRQADMFLDLLDGKDCHLTTLQEARDNLRVALAAKESYAARRIIQV